MFLANGMRAPAVGRGAAARLSRRPRLHGRLLQGRRDRRRARRPGIRALPRAAGRAPRRGKGRRRCSAVDRFNNLRVAQRYRSIRGSPRCAWCSRLPPTARVVEVLCFRLDGADGADARAHAAVRQPGRFARLARSLRRPRALRALPARAAGGCRLDWIDVRRGALARPPARPDGSMLGSGTSELAIRNQFAAWLQAHAAMKAELEAFVLHEARLLDERRFADWLALFAEDGEYWVPTLPGQASPQAALSLFHEPKPLLAMRVARLERPDMHSQAPASRTVHHVSAVEVCGELEVRSALIVAEWRAGEARWFAGRVAAPPAARGGSLAHRPEARGPDRQRGAAACYHRTVLAESAPRSPRRTPGASPPGAAAMPTTCCCPGCCMRRSCAVRLRTRALFRYSLSSRRALWRESPRSSPEPGSSRKCAAPGKHRSRRCRHHHSAPQPPLAAGRGNVAGPAGGHGSFAETRALAEDADGLRSTVEWEELEPVVDAKAALAADAPPAASRNSMEISPWSTRSRPVRSTMHLERAHLTVRREMRFSRHTGVPLEARTVHRYRLRSFARGSCASTSRRRCRTQMRAASARHKFGLAEDRRARESRPTWAADSASNCMSTTTRWRRVSSPFRQACAPGQIRLRPAGGIRLATCTPESHSCRRPRSWSTKESG